jgi:hypothetical protein
LFDARVSIAKAELKVSADAMASRCWFIMNGVTRRVPPFNGRKHQTLVATMETLPDRIAQSAVAGFMEGYYALNRIMDARVKPGHDTRSFPRGEEALRTEAPSLSSLILRDARHSANALMARSSE